LSVDIILEIKKLRLAPLSKTKEVHFLFLLGESSWRTLQNSFKKTAFCPPLKNERSPFTFSFRREFVENASK